MNAVSLTVMPEAKVAEWDIRLNNLEAMFTKAISELNKDDRWLTTKEAANYIGQTEEWVRDNKLRLGVCINGKRLTFKKTFLENYMMLHFQIEKPSKRK